MTLNATGGGAIGVGGYSMIHKADETGGEGGVRLSCND